MIVDPAFVHEDAKDNVNSSPSYVVARAPTEAALTRIRRGLLHADDIGVYDNFFSRG
ncbi:MAG TPA: hypothetical protein VNW97_20825 [Candidatus Saccharimonadales bacterium]|jgi:hypothetical protein|nr:hypothetical protein [Candidatus Saccharimonadales bacterium]